MQDDFEDIDRYMKSTDKTHYVLRNKLFKEVGKELCSESLKQKGSRLLDFEFRNHDKYKLPDWRIEALSKLVQEQARYICS